VNDALEALRRHPGVWRGVDSGAAFPTIPSGFRRLDERLPGRGWPLQTLVEVLLPASGVGELRLLLPLLRALSGEDAGPRRWIAWAAPPHVPYAPALASAGLDPARMLIVRSPPGQALWAMEQALRSGACAAALGWVDRAEDSALRRLKLAAEEGGSLGLLFRPAQRAVEHSPASLRLLLEPRDTALDIRILKSRGGAPSKISDLFGPGARDRGPVP
jgi:hypothetical protein